MPASIEMDWLSHWARVAPQSIALKDADSGRELSYDGLFQSSIRIAQALRDRYEIQAGDRVAILAVNELEYIQAFFALQKLGAIMVPVNYRLTAREVSHVLSDCTPKLLIHQNQFQELVSALTHLPPRLMRFDGDESLCSLARTETRAEKDFNFQPDFTTPVMILYTSGTTGNPKGAIITQGMLFWNSINTSLRLNLTQSDVTLSFAPFFHTGGWNVLTTPLLHRGAKLVLLKKFEADRFLQLCDSEGVTLFFGVPTTLDMMYHSSSFAAAKLAKVRYAIVGGEPMPVELIRVWQTKGIPIRQGYGLTEFGPNVFSLGEEDSLRKIGSIGFTNFYIEAQIRDDHDSELKGPDQVGELVLRGPTCTPGYWKNAEATAASLRDGWFHTGDLVRRDSEGYYYVVGRKKDMYISGGENVYPPEVEQYLRTHPKIREVAVIGVADPKWGEVGKAFIVLMPGATLTVDEVFSFCAGNLAKYKTPKQVEFLPELPKSDSGKILKRKLA